MDIHEAMAEVRKVFPSAQYDEDMDGQIIIYTDRKLSEVSTELVPYEEDWSTADYE